jgi:hypothetical protein
MNEENVFKLTDIINTPQLTNNQNIGITPETILKTIESIFSTVTKFQEKAQQFQMVYGRQPMNKQELKVGRPLVAIDQYSKATQEQIQRKPKTENVDVDVEKMKVNFDDEKFYTIINNSFDGLIKISEPYKNLTVEDSLKKIVGMKGLIIGKIIENLKKTFLECVILND